MSVPIADRDDFEGFYNGEFYEGGDENDLHWQIYGGRGMGHSQNTHDDDHLWFVPGNLSAGGYGTTTRDQANCEAMSDIIDELVDKMGGDRDWYRTVTGCQWAFHIDSTPLEIIHVLNGLESDPIISDDKYYELEEQSRDEAWDNWISGDYRRALESHFDGDAYDVEDEDLKQHFFEHVDEIHEESDGGWYADVDKAAKNASRPPKGFLSNEVEDFEFSGV